MTKKEYNGWYNYETWVVSLWMDNEAGSYNSWQETAQEYYDDARTEHTSLTRKESAASDLADKIKEVHEENLPEVQGFAADLLNAAMSEVNWYEIAEHLLDDIEEETEEKQESA